MIYRMIYKACTRVQVQSTEQACIIFAMPSFLPKNKANIAAWRRDSHQIEKYQFIHNFLPHPYHQTRARLLSHQALFVYVLAIIMLFAGFNLVSKVFPGVLGYASNITVTDLFQLTNQKRIDAGLKELRLNDTLSEAAREKAEDMFESDYWAHVSPSGKEPWDFILAENYDYIYAGENLAKNFNTSKEVVQAWISSPSHRENVMNTNYDEIGYAVVNGVLDGYETTLVVQMFGKSRSSSYAASVQGENKILDSAKANAVEGASEEQKVQFNVNAIESSILPTVPLLDMTSASRVIGIVFGIYLGILLLLDVWYTKRHAIFKMTGHTLAHLSFLIILLLSMFLVLIPGKIL